MFKRIKYARGQAVTETVIAMPLFLFGLFGMMFAIREGVISERTQMTARQSGVITSLRDPYTDFSLYNIYQAVNGGAPVDRNLNCGIVDTNLLTVNRVDFFRPLVGKYAAQHCERFQDMWDANFTQNVLLQSSTVIAHGDFSGSGFFNFHAAEGTFGNKTVGTYAQQNFFRSPDVGSLLLCSRLADPIRRSLLATGDTFTPAKAPDPIVTLSPVPVLDQVATPDPATGGAGTGGAPQCVAFAAASPVPTPTPTQSPFKVPCDKNCNPTPTPTTRPTPTPRPGQTATPTKPPTPPPPTPPPPANPPAGAF